MKYFAIYICCDANSYKKSHMAFVEDENAISVELVGNPYEAFRSAPEYIEQ